MSRKLVIFGNGDIAQLADYYFTNDSDYEVVAFTVDAEYLAGDQFNGRDNVAFQDLVNRFPPGEYSLFVAVSYSGMNTVRENKVRQGKDWGYAIASYVSSRATVLSETSGCSNCFILEDNTIQPFVTIGDNVTLWSGNHIGHHSRIGDNCFITSHVVVSGGVHIGRNCFIGVNATLHDHLEIADYSLIAAGSLVNRNTESYGVYLGSPARKVKSSSMDVKL